MLVKEMLPLKILEDEASLLSIGTTTKFQVEAFSQVTPPHVVVFFCLVSLQLPVGWCSSASCASLVVQRPQMC